MIQELLIINNAGIALFYHNFLKKDNKKDDYQLIASFLDQIAYFTKFGLKNELELIKMNNYFLSFYKHNKSNHRIVLKCDQSNFDNSKIIKKSLDLVAKKLGDNFYNRYKEELEHFDGNVSQFNSFTNTIEDIFGTTQT